MDEYKIENFEIEIQTDFQRISDARANMAEYDRHLNKLKAKLEKTDPASPNYQRIRYEYEDALDDKRNIECYIKHLEEEAEKHQKAQEDYENRE